MTAENAGAGVDSIIDAAVATPEVTSDAQAEPVSQPTPEADEKPAELDKSTINRLNRLQRRIGQLTAQKHQTAQEAKELREKLAQYEKATETAPTKEGSANDAPKEEDFAGKPYGEFLDALAEYKAEKKAEALSKRLEKQLSDKLNESTQKAQEQSKAAKDSEWREQRIEHASANADRAKATFPDYQQIYNDYEDVLSALPPDIESVLLDADNPSFAFYAMAKDGSIEQLSSMTPVQAARAIALAEQRGLSLKKPVTNAPAPLASAKGTAPGKKSLDQMSGDELKDWLNSP